MSLKRGLKLSHCVTQPALPTLLKYPHPQHCAASPVTLRGYSEKHLNTSLQGACQRIWDTLIIWGRDLHPLTAWFLSVLENSAGGQRLRPSVWEIFWCTFSELLWLFLRTAVCVCIFTCHLSLCLRLKPNWGWYCSKMWLDLGQACFYLNVYHHLYCACSRQLRPSAQIWNKSTCSTNLGLSMVCALFCDCEAVKCAADDRNYPACIPGAGKMRSAPRIFFCSFCAFLIAFLAIVCYTKWFFYSLISLFYQQRQTP